MRVADTRAMRRILVIGSGGAGKSTLARGIGQRLGLPVVHLVARARTEGVDLTGDGGLVDLDGA